MKKRSIDCLSIQDIENLIIEWEKQIQQEEDRMNKHIDSIYESLVEFHVPILENAFSSENNSIADMFKDYDKDIIYINGKIFLLKKEHTKGIHKESYDGFKKYIFSIQIEWIENSFKSIEKMRNCIEKLHEEIESKKEN